MQWYNDLPRISRSSSGPVGDWESSGGGTVGLHSRKKATLLGYFSSLNCPVCDERTMCGLCQQCKVDKQRVAVISEYRLHSAEQKLSLLQQVILSLSTFVGFIFFIAIVFAGDYYDCPYA